MPARGRPKVENPSAATLAKRNSRIRRGVAKAEPSDVAAAASQAAENPRESFHDASLRKEIAMADQREMENAVRRAELVESVVIAQEWSEITASIKNSILAVPDRVALRCEGESARVIREIMMTELRLVLLSLSENISEAA